MSASRNPARKLTAALRVLPQDKTSIKAAAETVSLAFGDDPLLRFLYKRPSEETWATNLESKTQLWQQHRLRGYQLDGDIIEARVDGQNAGLCVVHPPKSWTRFVRWQWWACYLKATVLQLWYPAKEDCCEGRRVQTLYESARSHGEKFAVQYKSRGLHYIDMIVVNPKFQGLGIGRQLMRDLIDRIGNAPSYLECTNAANVAFYEKFGFKVVSEDDLIDPDDETLRATMYYMIRDTSMKI